MEAAENSYENSKSCINEGSEIIAGRGGVFLKLAVGMGCGKVGVLVLEGVQEKIKKDLRDQGHEI